MTVVHTESEQKITVSQTIRMRIEKFGSLLNSRRYEEDLWSEGVSSVQVPGAAWKLLSRPREQHYISRKHNYRTALFLTFSLHLTGYEKKTIRASCHIYLIGETHSIRRGTCKFGSSGWSLRSAEVNGDQVKRALHVDGQLLVVADIEFLAPDNSAAKEMAKEEGDLVGKWQNAIVGKLCEDGPDNDCTRVVGGEELKAHRSILAAISPVFAKMFGNPTFQQAMDGIVPIEDPPGMLMDTSSKPYRALLFYANTRRVTWISHGSFSDWHLQDEEEQTPEEMTETKAIVHTESESKEKLAIHAHLTIKLRVEKFGLLMESYKPGVNLWSEGVTSKLAPSSVWELQLYPNGDIEKNKGTISVSLCLTGPMASDKETLDTTYCIYLLDEAGSKIDVVERTTRNFGKTSYGWGWHVDHDQVKKALQADGSLLVAADVEFLPPDDEVTRAEKKDLFSKWHDSIGKLLEAGTNSDCTIVVDGEELKAHRSILAAISPIFERMFGNSAFQQAQDGIVRIEDPAGILKDSSAKPYRALLYYAYTGRVDWTLFGDCKRDVLVVACKYLVLDLKYHVEELLIDEIDPKSFAELVLLADTYSCSELKKACVRYLSSNTQAVVFDPQWQVLVKTRMDLSCELLQLASEDKTPTITTAAEEGGTK